LFQAGLSSYDASLFERSSSSKHHCKRQTTKPNTASKSVHQASDVEKDGQAGATDFEKQAEALGGGDGQRGDDNQELEIGDEVLGLRDSYGASVLHIAALHGYSSVLTTILDKWIGDVNLEDGNGLTAVDYAASGRFAASLTVDEEAACEKCRQLLCSRGGMHSSIWLTDNPHASA
jgi:ankyrin repeat protein